MDKNLESHVMVELMSEEKSPHPSAPYNMQRSKVKIKPGHLWQRIFTVVLAPFVFLSIPTHLLVFKSGSITATSTAQWLRSIFIPVHPISLILTIFTLITTAIASFWVMYWIGFIFYSLVILGDLNFDILDSIYNLIQSAPIYLPTMSIWIFGFSLKSTLLGFDRVQFELEKLIENSVMPGIDTIAKPQTYSSKALLIRVFSINFLVLSIVIITMVLDFTRFKLSTSTSYWVDADYWYGLWILLCYNFVLSLYCTVCWGLQCQLSLFSYYLNALLLSGQKPTFKILADVKYYFKKCAAQIVLVNRAFSGLVSAIIVILLCFVIINTLFIIFYSVPSSVSIAVKIVEKYLAHFGIDIDIVSPWEKYSHFFTHLGETSDTSDGNSTLVAEVTITSNTPDILEEYGPVFVRKTVAYIYLVFAQLGLIFFLGIQAISVNTMMRYFSVQFNDYMSSNVGHVSMDLYNEFRVVRFYITSALNFPGKWIILRIPIMNHVPFIRNKIHRNLTT